MGSGGSGARWVWSIEERGESPNRILQRMSPKSSKVATVFASMDIYVAVSLSAPQVQAVAVFSSCDYQHVNPVLVLECPGVVLVVTATFTRPTSATGWQDC
eukprot:COSAG02_NODE_137_length_34526_cov_94.448079_17_plen_101_part_00